MVLAIILLASSLIGAKLGQSFISIIDISPSADTIASPPYMVNSNFSAETSAYSFNLSSSNLV